MGKIVAIANQKGGVGKTTTAVNLSSCVAALGKKVLIVDLDPQGNTTTGYGIAKRSVEVGTYELLVQDAETRQAAYDARVESYLEEGLSEEEAAQRAKTVTPAPEGNESGTGLSLELLSDGYDSLDTGFDNTEAYRWLTAYAAEYGFILRWPADRQLATGMVYQPWRWRYVGAENARAIRASGLSLEEFLALYQQTQA